MEVLREKTTAITISCGLRASRAFQSGKTPVSGATMCPKVKLTSYCKAMGRRQCLNNHRPCWLGVVPLQNGIFNSGAVIVPTVVSLRTTNSLLPLEDQSAILGTNVLNTAHSIIWLGQEMLPFTTSEYTLAPFEASLPGKALNSNQTLTAETIFYSTDLSCRPPSDVTTAGKSDTTFDDGQ